MTVSTTLLRFGVLFALLSAAVAHTHMFFPAPRNQDDYSFTKKGANACENMRTDLTERRFLNYAGGFIKFALTPAIRHTRQQSPSREQEIINGQCYTGKMGSTLGQNPCVGKNVTIPNWVADGTDYVLSFSSIGGFNSNGNPTKQLPLYHNCANIRIKGGVTLEQPANWVAPFIGGSQDKVNGKAVPQTSAAEPADPSVVNTNDVDKSNIKAGVPDGWAVKGGSPAPSKGTSASAAPASDCAASARSLNRRDREEIEDILKRLGHIARAVQGMAQ
ncbi:hypothetical protein B0H13DRAFT_1984764 [Mycena leptocephala]|nr:hypothetical protein B0H13DRAFT_1984764 [Mycena leptocephala]